MKSTVIKAFYDLQDPARTVYQIGSAFEGTAERVGELQEKGYVVAIKEPKPRASKARKPAAKKEG